MKNNENKKQKGIIDLLPYGAISDIVKITGVSRPSVYKILNNVDSFNGSADNYTAVMNIATEMIKSRKNLIKNVTSKISKVAS